MWNFQPPKDSTMGDHDVPRVSDLLANKNIALLVSGGIAAMKAPTIARAFRRHGANVVAYVSEEALNYTTIAALEWATTNKVVDRLTSDSEHLSKNRPFDGYILVPGTYNSINKFAHGVADSAITTTLASALGLLERGKTKIFVVPTMHGDMHNSILIESMQALKGKGVTIIPPRDDFGKNNIPYTRDLVNFVIRSLSTSPLKGVPVLVTSGPTPVPIDDVRFITNKFKGNLGLEIARQLWLHGADVHLILGGGYLQIEDKLPFTIVKTFDEYRQAVTEKLSGKNFQYGIFAAAVADYRPVAKVDGKIPSGGNLKSIELQPTEKVIDEVVHNFPNTKLISFKFELNSTHEQLLEIAAARVRKGHLAVVANNGNDPIDFQGHTAYLVSKSRSPLKMIGKSKIASCMVDFLEADLLSR